MKGEIRFINSQIILIIGIFCSNSVIQVIAQENIDRKAMELIYAADIDDYQILHNDLPTEDKNDASVKFWQAYYEYKASEIARGNEGKNLAKASAVSCTKLLKEINVTSVYYARSQALQSLCLGMQIALNPIKGMFLGPRAGRSIENALKLSPQDSIVQLLAAIDEYYKPEKWGGNKKNAIARLDKITIDKYMWLLTEAYAYKALIYLSLDDNESAKQSYFSAKKLSPDYLFLDFIRRRLEIQDNHKDRQAYNWSGKESEN